MSQLPPDVRLARLASAYQLSRAVQVAARLELGRRLDDGPRHVRELAAATSSDAGVLTRLLRFLAEIGVVEELDPEDGEMRFGPTDLSRILHHVDNLAQGDEAWGVWGALPAALGHGRPVFAEVHGKPFYDYAADHPEREAAWQEWNAKEGRSWGAALATMPELEDDTTVVDVGGGVGAVLAELLRRRPRCRGVLFDLPSVVARSEDALAQDGAGDEIGDRLRIVGGDARQSVPEGGDLYLLCRVLFNWDDEAALAILRACRSALGTGQLWLIEPWMPEPGESAWRGTASADLHHFLLWGGRYRRRAEHAELFTAAGLRITGELGSQQGLPVLEARGD